MSLNSINTNIGAMVALQSLNRTSEELAATQKRISTGYRVADARDDGAAFAVAERVRGDIAATTSANEQMGGVKGLADVTRASLENVSKSLVKLKELTVKLADGSITAEQRSQYQEQAKQVVNNIKAFIEGASYNGTNLINTGGADAKVVIDAAGGSFTLSAFDMIASVYDVISDVNTWDATQASQALTAGGAVSSAITATLTRLNTFGSYSRFLDTQINFNKSKIDAMEAGMGALVDADLARESAKLQALQIRQQLGAQALGIANQAPQVLLSLFR
ncbi:MAG: flagellin [Rhodovarius sp.]|nr:flagellin [Rhodovarius sp.]MCX7931474.1 flagellin [Rhodovarius sp.]